jgi:hypothetical protein
VSAAQDSTIILMVAAVIVAVGDKSPRHALHLAKESLAKIDAIMESEPRPQEPSTALTAPDRQDPPDNDEPDAQTNALDE